MRFGKAMRLSVRPPFRLDRTVDALRRLPADAVDVVGNDATYYRALTDASGSTVVSVRQTKQQVVEVRATGPNADRWLPRIETMLGAGVDLAPWYERSAAIQWLRPLSDALAGLKPPRYPSLWEACAHAVVFQQISLHAASAIMQRLVECIGEPTAVEKDVRVFAFPQPDRCLDAPDAALRAAGLSGSKASALRAIAGRLLHAPKFADELQAVPTVQAAQMLQQLSGIGPWSASVVLLRGLGRLDTFPLRDSGVARSLARIGGENVDLTVTLDALGPTRGMLYYHLLLGRFL